ncbi:uncharacterized protein [Diadema antillarum]|uniref:uncharacterized protein n=1 Tax=Diadema antillarum TaxID=105358 RepID=UPI003A8ACAC6
MSDEECEDRKPVTLLNTEEQADASDESPQKAHGAVLRRTRADHSAENNSDGAAVRTGETDIRLIHEVRRHPCIYNPQHPHNRDPLVKEKTWQQIAQNIDVCPEYCKLRWKSIRDRFVKTQKEIRVNGMNGYRKTLKPYRFTHYLGFLKKHLRKQNRPPSYPYPGESKGVHDQDSSLSITDITKVEEDDDDEDDDDDLLQGWSAMEDSNEDVSQQSSHHTSSDQQHLNNGQHSGASISVPSISVPSTDMGNERVLSYLDSVPSLTTLPNNTSTPVPSSSPASHSFSLHQEAERFDEVMHFLVSLAPAMRRLPPHQQSLARIKIQSVLHDLEFSGR